MKKDYTCSKEKNFSFVYDSEIENLINNHQNVLKATSKFILSLLGTQNFYLELIKNGDNEIKFKAIANKKNLILTIINEYAVINYENQDYVFCIDWTDRQYFIRLALYRITKGNKIISQSFDAHQIKIEVQIKNRIYSFIIPYDIDYYLDINCFNELSINTTILDLKRMYMRYFFKNQSVYERRQCLTKIAIREITEENKTILVDELTIREGFIEDYLLSSIKGNLIIRMKGKSNESSEIQILNYQTETDVDFSNEIKKLYERSRRMNIE